jgi:hypothetical protein
MPQNGHAEMDLGKASEGPRDLRALSIDDSTLQRTAPRRAIQAGASVYQQDKVDSCSTCRSVDPAERGVIRVDPWIYPCCDSFHCR